MSHIDKKIEFESIKHKVYYLDWNVLTYLINPFNIPKDSLRNSVLCLHKILFEMLNRDIYVIPYSNGHYLDILSGGEKYFQEKIEFIDSVSKGWQTFESKENREELGIYHIPNIWDDFKKYRINLKQTQSIMQEIYPILEPLYEFSKKYIRFQSSDEKISDEHKKDLEVLIDCIFPKDDEDKKISLLKLNKKFKTQLRDIDNRKIKFPDFQYMNQKYPDLSTAQTIDLCIEKSDFPFNSLHELNEKVELIKDTPALSQHSNKVLKLYFLAEFLNVSTEKLKSKKAFQGIVNDIFHISYGIRSHCFVTEDDALYRKAIFINDYLGLKANIFKIDDFNKVLLQLISSYVKVQNNIEEREFNYVFNDSEGNKIREYKINV